MTAKCACNCAMPSDSKSMKYYSTHPLQIFGHILCPMTMDWKIHLLQFPLSRNHTLCHFKHLNVSMRTMPKTDRIFVKSRRLLQERLDWRIMSSVITNLLARSFNCAGRDG
ncbi:uncharacterized protein LOC120331038 isoform X1 [Styela clava]